MGNLKSLALLALLFSLSLAVFADTSTDATHAKDDVKPSTEATDGVEPQQGWFGGGCRYGCCGGWWAGRCRYCCSSQAEANVNEVVETVEPQQGWSGGGCRYGCCGGWWAGRCRYCCSSQAEAKKVMETVEPQQRTGCRLYGCCGSFTTGRCTACCSKPMATEKVKKKEEAKP
ncbi:PREDICTED: multiple epidermal growth factor-like domains protein 6 isoform X2 [Camelina sativa]|uniref:Multiple epidermal growth factor-like domains protein 6 isoform X2 n=1 Tax=Camelina sativa TaxID=90675 RepID=A0ABM1RQD6_CAMSA|nr:PREDICTED: multiple epidermal growth factor-like domains protein 6 isoform X2 [Camelina sativa]